jgi:hypothetical protein
VDPAEVETAWRDHRKPAQPATFVEVHTILQSVIPESQHLLIARNYSQHYLEVCPRCTATPAFRFADPQRILSLLGYV